jgi:hypothetical protein
MNIMSMLGPPWKKLQTLRRLPRKDLVLDDYYTQLLAEYERLHSAAKDTSAASAAEKFVEEAKVVYDKDRLTWAMAFAFERLILTLLSDSEVAARAWHLRDRYRGIVTKDQYALYEKTHDPSSTGEVLRNDMASLLLALTEYYTLRQGIEEERTEFSHRVQLMTGLLLAILGLFHPAMSGLWKRFHGFPVVATIVAGIFVLAAGWWTERRSWKNTGVAILILDLAGCVVAFTSTLPPVVGSVCSQAMPAFVTTLIMVILAGLFGGAFSMLQRVQSPVIDGDQFSNLLSLRTARREILLAPIIGAVGALVLYCIFDAGLLKGTLFPAMFEVRSPRDGSLSFAAYLCSAGPLAGVDHAKLLVWSFVAGFSERLLPDALDRITKQAASSSTTNK